MEFSKEVSNLVKENHLLTHPFYQAWVEGKLTMPQLQNYACQYYWHVDAFPRYLSATHSLCTSPRDRKLLLENLVDEEGLKDGCESHPDLWIRFVEGLGVLKRNLLSQRPCSSIKKLIKGFMSFSRTSYPEGLAALYTYESQVPEVAESKIEGLKKHYGIQDSKTLSFFLVHKDADQIHRRVCEEQLNRLKREERKDVLKVVKKISSLLRGFLSEMQILKSNPYEATPTK